MIRRSLILAPFLLAAPALAQRAAAPPQGPALTERDRADLARVEAYLNGMTTLRARFLQIAQNGAAAEGTAWIWRPGRMRFEYDPPEPLLLVADSGQFLMYDRELRAPTTLPTGTTPLGILLRREVRLSGDVTVTAVERSGGFLRVTLFRTSEPGEGRLTLVFNPDPLELRQWAVVDAQRRETRVTLSRIETGLRFPAGLFQFNNPMFFEPGGFGARQGAGN
ncbi:outer membrane lipoprotein carrier protein LolA [Roseomonas eburnea]|uniref:Outer membrane lipoprotein carrier protein LolA n=1 Tax=Neoroseomonas eburnea TaxID=1346889 RepID=A0A9X9XDR7_9PROT|nr:outer membrane lipoprotein carrier protein LolA [Neoroseomonas eburnea]MBR0681853.1 outer membrane lipoprotein carrier protein LolA [Neoroseomonas eburnea]